MKRLLGIFIAIAIVTLAGYNVYASMNKEVKISKMALANVEALARDEGSSGNKCTVIHTKMCGQVVVCIIVLNVQKVITKL